MRIAYLINSLGIGGTERLVASLAERMAARGHQVLIITVEGRRPTQWETSVEVAYLGMRGDPATIIRGLGRLSRTLRSFRPDLIHSHNFHGNLLARAARLAYPHCALITTLHNEYEGGRVRMLALRLTDPLSNRTVAVSQAVAERALHLHATPAHKCQVIPNGIDTALFVPDPSRRAAMRNAMSAGNDFIWATTGRIVPAKDYPNLLQALHELHPAGPAVQLWVAGEGDQDYTASIRIQADDLGLHDDVQWLGMRHDVPALLDAADGFVLASAWEGMPLALAEAMAMGKPVAATGVGGVGELTGTCGLIVPPRDARSLARAMRTIMNTPPEAREFLGAQARKRILEQFSIDDRLDDWERLYREVTAAR